MSMQPLCPLHVFRLGSDLHSPADSGQKHKYNRREMDTSVA